MKELSVENVAELTNKIVEDPKYTNEILTILDLLDSNSCVIVLAALSSVQKVRYSVLKMFLYPYI